MKFLRNRCSILVVVALLNSCDEVREEEVIAPDAQAVAVDTVSVALDPSSVVALNGNWHPVTVEHALDLHAGDRVVAVLHVGLGSNNCAESLLVGTRTILADSASSPDQQTGSILTGAVCPAESWPPGQFDGQFACTEEFEVDGSAAGSKVARAWVKVTPAGCDSLSCSFNNRSLNLVIVHEHQ